MAGNKLSTMDETGAITGVERIEVLQGGQNKAMTLNNGPHKVPVLNSGGWLPVSLLDPYIQTAINTHGSRLDDLEAIDSDARLDALEASQAGSMIGFTTKALMDADLAHDAGVLARVTNDDVDPANNGVYIKLGATGTGSWQKSDDEISLLAAEIAELQVEMALQQDYNEQLDQAAISYIQTVNLYNPANKVADSFVNVSTGSISAASGWVISEFIPVEAGESYTISANANKRSGYAFYADKTTGSFISGGNNTVNATTSATVVAPSGASYLVIHLQSDTIPEPTEVMINAGAVALPYEPWHAPIPQIKTEAIAGENSPGDLAARIGTLEDSFVLVTPKNLYNPAAKVEDSFVAADGSIGSASGWARTEFISVTEGQAYTISANGSKRVGAAFYTSLDSASYISGSYNGQTVNATTARTLTAPAGAAYLVVNLQSSSQAEPVEVQIEQGSSATPFEAWYAPYRAIQDSNVVGPDSPALLAPRLAVVENALELVPGKNLYNPAERRSDTVLNASTGAIGASAGWAVSGFIPVEAGKQYTISADANKRTGVAFYAGDAANGADFISGSGNTGTVNASTTLTVTAPSGAVFMVMNVQSDAIPEPEHIQVEQSAAATEFEEWMAPALTPKETSPETLARIASLEAAIGSDIGASLRMSATQVAGGATLEVPVGGKTFEWRLSPNLAASATSSSVFNFHSYIYDDVIQSVDSTDDVAPFRLNGATIGANHGWRAAALTASAHGKTWGDVGSVWTDGTNQFVIVAIIDANRIQVTRRVGNDSAVPTGGVLTHVSGASHTSDIGFNATQTNSWYPVYSDRRTSAAVDRISIPMAGGSYSPKCAVTFAESYDVLNKDSQVAWLETRAGTIEGPVDDCGGDPEFSVSNCYSFDSYGGMTIATDFLALESVSAFQDIMFTQAYRLAANGGILRYLIPDTLPLTHEGVDYDFTRPVDMTGWAPATRLDITAARIADPDVWPDRVIQFNGSIGMAVGYLPIRDAAPDVRPTRASRKALQISEIGKIYMSAIDSAARTALAAGDYFGVVAYRAFFALSADRTACYVVRGPAADWLFVDWHASISDRVQLPPDLQGRGYSIHRKTPGVTIRSLYATDSVVFDVTSSDGSGQYAILRFDH